MLSEFERLTVEAALKKMFEGSHFSICTIDICLKITGCIPETRAYNALHALHCVHFSDMTQELRDMVFMQTMALFNNTGFNTEAIRIIGNHAQTILPAIRHQTHV